MKTLNLDQLGTAEQRELVVGGKTHAVKSMSVKTFIGTTKIIEELKNDSSVGGQISGTVSIIRQSVPTLTETDLMDLSLEQLKILMEFVRGDEPEAVAEHDKVIEGDAVSEEGKQVG